MTASYPKPSTNGTFGGFGPRKHESFFDRLRKSPKKKTLSTLLHLFGLWNLKGTEEETRRHRCCGRIFWGVLDLCTSTGGGAFRSILLAPLFLPNFHFCLKNGCSFGHMFPVSLFAFLNVECKFLYEQLNL